LGQSSKAILGYIYSLCHHSTIIVKLSVCHIESVVSPRRRILSVALENVALKFVLKNSAVVQPNFEGNANTLSKGMGEVGSLDSIGRGARGHTGQI
jgi:hypothetical protein